VQQAVAHFPSAKIVHQAGCTIQIILNTKTDLFVSFIAFISIERIVKVP
jgi:hypothetical protein